MELARVFQFFFIVNLLLFACLTSAQEVDDEKEFSYNEESENGPAHWGEIHRDWENCSTGRTQSPIDITNQRVQIASRLGGLKRNYKPANAILINSGHDMMIRWPNAAGHIEINGILYKLRQIHWHSPSEHAINGRRFDMEVHMVHQTEDNRTAVVAIMYKIGRRDSFLSMIEHDLEAITNQVDVEKTIGIIDPKLIKLGSRKYYRYIGSLTTPPCTPNVLWTIIRKVEQFPKSK